MPDDVVEYLNAVLERERRIRTAEESRVREYEAAGHRIVDGGQTGRDTWQVTDWRTDAVLAQGSDGIKGYLAVTESEQARGWMHVDRITADLGEDDTALPEKLPLSLCEVLEQWVTAQHTADTEVATLLGWPVEQVAEARRGR